MQKLRSTIDQYSRWSDLTIYIDRMEAHLESDFSHSLENAKALLEAIGKEICKARGVELKADSSINGVLKNAFSAMGYTNTNLVNQISSALATIGQQVGELRNEIGATSHGRSLDEIRERNNNVDLLTREFLIDSTLVVAVFLIRTFENKKEDEKPPLAEAEAEERLDYFETTAFNDFWDDIFGEFAMGEYAYTASEILFNVDYKAYKSEYTAFLADAFEVVEEIETGQAEPGEPS